MDDIAANLAESIFSPFIIIPLLILAYFVMNKIIKSLPLSNDLRIKIKVTLTVLLFAVLLWVFTYSYKNLSE